MNQRQNWNYPNAIRFGAGRISELPAACLELGMQRPLLVTDPGLAVTEIVERALDVNGRAGLMTSVFSEIKGNPTGENVAAGVQCVQDGGHDGVIAFGGGSALDAAKTVALMVGQSRPLWDFEDRDDWYTRVNEEKMLPVVAVPTTAGTGSEVGRASVISDVAAGRKKIIFHPRMLPGRVICDPELTIGMPPALTAAVGIDALSHNLEAWCSPLYHPMADGIALEGIRLVATSLERAFDDGRDVEARANMLAASTLGATAFQKGLGAMHAVTHPVGALFDCHHGLTIAVVMPYVLSFNRDAISEKMDRLARYLGLSNADGSGFDQVLNWVLELRKALGIPATLSEIDVPSDAAEKLAQEAAVDPSAGTNPIPLTEANLRPLIEQMIG